jgi:methylmalonyl-CoA mutase cobalamin-binding subunit
VDRESLVDALYEAGICPTSYLIGGNGYAENCYSLIYENSSWLVVFVERGVRRYLHSSASESEACEFLWKRLNEDTTTRRR